MINAKKQSILATSVSFILACSILSTQSTSSKGKYTTAIVEEKPQRREKIDNPSSSNIEKAKTLIDINRIENKIKEIKIDDAKDQKQKSMKLEDNWELIFLNLEYPEILQTNDLDLNDSEPNEMEEIDRIFLEALTKPFPKEITKFESWNIKGLGSFNIPVELNHYVEYYIYLFTETKFREHYERWLRRYFKYNKFIRALLHQQGLPDDLIFVAMAESGFSNKAVSHAGAVGMWQFIEETAKRYSLRIDPWIDERRDPVKSTIAASNYLKELYDAFGHWYLAWAGYNAGERRIEKAIRKANKDDYWHFVKNRLIPRETAGYVPKIIALAIITKNLEKFGFNPQDYYEQPWEFDEIEVPYLVSFFTIAKLCSCSIEDIVEFNPAFRHPIATGIIRVPKGKGEIVKERLKILDKFLVNYTPVMRAGFSILPSELFSQRVIGGWLQISPKNQDANVYEISDLFGVPEEKIRKFNQIDGIIKQGEVISIPIEVYSRSFLIYRVREKDTIQKIARKFGTSPQDIIAINNLKTGKVYPGQLIKIPARVFISQQTKSKSAGIQLISYHRATTYNPGRIKYVYTVKRGDNLSKIAKAFNIKIEDIKKLNNLNSDKIYPGQKLLIPQRPLSD